MLSKQQRWCLLVSSVLHLMPATSDLAPPCRMHHHAPFMWCWNRTQGFMYARQAPCKLKCIIAQWRVLVVQRGEERAEQSNREEKQLSEKVPEPEAQQQDRREDRRRACVEECGG